MDTKTKTKHENNTHTIKQRGREEEEEEEEGIPSGTPCPINPRKRLPPAPTAVRGAIPVCKGYIEVPKRAILLRTTVLNNLYSETQQQQKQHKKKKRARKQKRPNRQQPQQDREKEAETKKKRKKNCRWSALEEETCLVGVGVGVGVGKLSLGRKPYESCSIERGERRWLVSKMFASEPILCTTLPLSLPLVFSLIHFLVSFVVSFLHEWYRTFVVGAVGGSARRFDMSVDSNGSFFFYLWLFDLFFWCLFSFRCSSLDAYSSRDSGFIEESSYNKRCMFCLSFCVNSNSREVDRVNRNGFAVYH